MSNGQPNKNYGSLIISALLSVLLTVVVFSFGGMKDDIEKLDERKANKDVVEVQLQGIKNNLEEIKRLLENRKN